MRKTFLTLLFFSLLGFAASAVMVKMHLKLETQGFQERSFCNLSDFVDCDTALASRFAKIGGIPTAQLGALYYLFFILGTLYSWASERGRRGILSLMLLGSVFAFLYSVVMASVSFFHIKVLCLLCLATYLANLGLLLAIPRALGGSLFSFLGRGAIQRVGWVSPVLFLVFMGGGLLFFRGLGPQEEEHETKIPDEVYLKHFYSVPPVEFRLEGAPSRGSEGAKVVMVEFSDFQCPFCRRAAFSLKPYLAELRHEVRQVFMNYPLDKACNPKMNWALHPQACLAAKAVLCAHKKGRFWEYHDLIFENQRRLSRETLMGLSKEADLDSAEFNVCLVSGETESFLSEQIEEGNRVGVRGTPALFINGRPFRDWHDPERLRLIVKEELKRLSASN